MPSLNIYLNEATHALAKRWKERVSLSDICARAIREELAALEDGKEISKLSTNWTGATLVELELCKRFKLHNAKVVPSFDDNQSQRAALGLAAAQYMDSIVSDGCRIGLCGGRQVWEVVRNLNPRRISASISSLGIELSNSRSEHVYSNTLSTILALLYQPKSSVHRLSNSDSQEADGLFSGINPKIILGSCSEFEPSSDFAIVLPQHVSSTLAEYPNVSEFCYRFIDESSKEISLCLEGASRRPELEWLNNASSDTSNHVIMVAGGFDKVKSISKFAHINAFNVLVTDEKVASILLE